MPMLKEDRVTKTGRMNPSPYLRILQLIDSKYGKDERGDLLIFLSGLNEITSVEEVAREYALQNQRWIVLPLHSSLSVAEQDQVFDYPPEGVRKCIISTNIAETSITLGISTNPNFIRINSMYTKYPIRRSMINHYCSKFQMASALSLIPEK